MSSRRQVGTYFEAEQLPGDAESTIQCPSPLGAYQAGEFARLRLGMAGRLTAEEGLFSRGPAAPVRARTTSL